LKLSHFDILKQSPGQSMCGFRVLDFCIIYTSVDLVDVKESGIVLSFWWFWVSWQIFVRCVEALEEGEARD